MSLKRVVAPYIPEADEDSLLESLSASLDNMPREELTFTPWSEYPYKPAVKFTIAHSTNAFLLKFWVEEENLRITCTKHNDPVYQDSCVEFFISFDAGRSYYNFEFNAAGVCLAGYGVSKNDRLHLPLEQVEKIRTCSMIKSMPGRQPCWDLTAIIPYNIMGQEAELLVGKQLRVNFYKCGDDTLIPHYLSWNNIYSEAPNFHLPRFFGEMYCNERGL